jgi:hypothetical protein
VLPIVAHFFSTYEQARSPYLAVLNDDDWWFSNHLAEGVAALRSNPSLVAYVSASVFTKDETDDHPLWIDRSGAVWLIAGMPSSWLKPWDLDAPQILALGWLYTPFHLSTLLARTSALKEALRSLEGSIHPTYTIDRLLFSQLALQGKLCYNPLPDTFVRWHPGNLVKSKASKEVRALERSTIDLIDDLAAEHGWNLRDLWAGVLSRMPREIEYELRYRLGLAHTSNDLRRHGFDRFFQLSPPRPRLRALRKMLAAARDFVLGN